jgi:hypothetical protein
MGKCESGCTLDTDGICVQCGWSAKKERWESRWTIKQQAPRQGREEVLPHLLRNLPHDEPQVKIGLIEREAMGKAKYGTVLQTHNGRNPLVDALQEATDLVMYLQQAALEGRAAGKGWKVAEILGQRAAEILGALEELTR